MTFVEFQPQARSAQKRSAKVVRRAPVGPEGMEMRGVEVACVERELSRREGSCTSLGSASRAQKEGVHSNDGIGLCCGVTLGVTDALRRVCLDSDLSAAAQAAVNAAAGWT